MSQGQNVGSFQLSLPASQRELSAISLTKNVLQCFRPASKDRAMFQSSSPHGSEFVAAVYTPQGEPIVTFESEDIAKWNLSIKLQIGVRDALDHAGNAEKRY